MDKNQPVPKPRRRDKSLVIRGVAFHRYQWTWIKRRAKTFKMGPAKLVRSIVDDALAQYELSHEAIDAK